MFKRIIYYIAILSPPTCCLFSFIRACARENTNLMYLGCQSQISVNIIWSKHPNKIIFLAKLPYLPSLLLKKNLSLLPIISVITASSSVNLSCVFIRLKLCKSRSFLRDEEIESGKKSKNVPLWNVLAKNVPLCFFSLIFF